MTLIHCRYCGAPMRFAISDISRAEYFYTCPTCKARSPMTEGQPQEVTIALATKRMPPEPRLYTAEDFADESLVPTVIWVEEPGQEPLAGVWQIDHYELQDGRAMETEELFDPARYNRELRVWDEYPDRAARLDAEWEQTWQS